MKAAILSEGLLYCVVNPSLVVQENHPRSRRMLDLLFLSPPCRLPRHQCGDLFFGYVNMQEENGSK
jgi:hypothetical protein